MKRWPGGQSPHRLLAEGIKFWKLSSRDAADAAFFFAAEGTDTVSSGSLSRLLPRCCRNCSPHARAGAHAHTRPTSAL